MQIVFIVSVALYCLFILKMILVWRSIKPPIKSKASISKNFISILVPIRNEEANINSAIKSILANDYDKDFYEILVINDHSTDNSSIIVQSLSEQYDHVKLIDSKPELSGKKQAISHAIQHAKGNIILCTDGDCQVPENWIANYNQAFQNNNDLQLIFGGVKYSANNTFEELLQMELMGLVCIGAATAEIKHPSMVNGANFSYKKEAFLEVNGYEGNEQIASGDDEFLLRKVFKKYPKGIHFLKSSNAIVGTAPPSNLSSLFNQRKRWASKWKLHKDWFSKITPAAIFLFNLFLILALFLSEVKLAYFMFFISLKLIVDLIFMNSMARYFSLKLNLLTFILLQIIYPFYVIFFGIASNFGKFTWKERHFIN